MAESQGLLGFVVDLIFQPGSSMKLVPAINVSVLCLLVVLLCAAHTKIAMIHLVVLSSLAVGLLLSVNWFYYEFQKAISRQEQDAPENSTVKEKSEKSD